MLPGGDSSFKWFDAVGWTPRRIFGQEGFFRDFLKFEVMQIKWNKSSAVAEMGTGWPQTTIDMGRNRHGQNVGVAAVPFFVGAAGSPSNTMSPGPRPTSVPSGILDLFSHLATIHQYYRQDSGPEPLLVTVAGKWLCVYIQCIDAVDWVSPKVIFWGNQSNLA